MKFNKMMFAALAFGAIAFIACEKKSGPVGPDPIDPVDPDPSEQEDPQEEEIPEVAAPGDGQATLVIHIPEGTECNGIAFKGTLDGAAWSGENTYVGLDDPNASKDDCIKFEKIEGTAAWFKATYKLGEAGLRGKICLIYTNDGSWQGQAVNWEVNDQYTTADWSLSGDGNLEVNGAGLVYVEIGGWQTSECVAPQDYNITVLVPEFCGEEFPIEVIGSFCGWSDDATVALTKVEGNKYTATIKATPNAEWKVRGQGGWDKEIQGLVDDVESEAYDTWVGVANNVLGEAQDVLMDYSDPAKYRWNVCAEDEPGDEE